MKPLDLCQFPLDSLSLIEASAGTGKTYAVANLYLRYLLEQQLSVEQILVVTFTEAATQELRDRIRARIQELSQVFESQGSDDVVLNHLYLNSQDIEADKLRLKIAERQIDQSEIHTIHGFCQQLLARYALDINVSFTQNLMEDTKPLLLRVCEDFWRQEILRLPQELLLEVYSNWATPEALMKSLEPLINRRPEVCSPPVVPGGLTVWQNHHESIIDWYRELRERTLVSIDEVQRLIAASKLKSLNHKNKWLASIRSWCESEIIDLEFPKASKRKNLFEVFTPQVLSEESKKGSEPPEHAYFQFLEDHLTKLPAPSRDVFLVQSYQLIVARVNEEKKQQNALSFDDLILSVSNALTNAETRTTLVKAVRERFAVALIDEFQDTDREQYHIFSSIFTSACDNQNDASMVLIGDPKQAIYAFRGGDIATYLRAKQDIAEHARGHLFTMDTNWRSSPSMVSAVNQVFEFQENAFMAEAIPFHPVNAAKGMPEALEGQAAINVGLLSNSGRKKEALTSILADHCVERILALLAQGNASYSDIAVLVRSGAEAELMKQRLAAYGVSASYEGKSNIYHSLEAQSIYVLLAAIAEPTDDYLVMRCLSDLFFCLDDERLIEIKNDDTVWDEYLDLFNELHRYWLRFGVLAAIRKAMHGLGVFAAWRHDDAQGSLWERRLSNVNQLAELLQNQSQKIRGHFALLRWFRQNITSSVLADDDSRLRLESDEQLIRIITIHKSKGLEYPYVFLPFFFSGRGADLAWFYDAAGKLNLDLAKQEKNIALVERERLAEDIRLLYVALTRAKYLCYIGTTFYKGAGQVSLGLAKTAWAYVLSRQSLIDGLDEESYHDSLEALASNSNGCIAVSVVDETGLSEQLKRYDSELSNQYLGQENEGQVQGSSTGLTSEVLERDLSSLWRIHSFTALMQENHARQLRLGLLSPSRKVIQKSERELSANSGEAENDGLSIFDFPRGSKAGTFLHTLFESIEFETVQPLVKTKSNGELLSLEEMISDKLSLTRLVDDDMLSAWADYLSQWLRNVLSVPLSQGFSLSQLSKDDFQAELEFYFKVDVCQSARFNALLRSHIKDFPSLDFATFNGHLKGAIDLVFVNQGQYFLLDYKSNFLGDQLEDYQCEKLQAAMLEHRYDLQYLIYCLALHRYLKARLGSSYSYERDFGGVYYLYLRGMPLSDPADQAGASEQPAQTGVYFTKPQPVLIEALDQYLEGV